MQKNKSSRPRLWVRSMMIAAGAVVLGASASAAMPHIFDAKISVDRALNSPTLTVRYSGVVAVLVELRVNGESAGTRTVVGSKASGETNFTINLDSLKDGDNSIEVRLYDRIGKLVGKDETNISIDRSDFGPIFLATPKVGATVMGETEIKAGLAKDVKSAYVSFFVDEQFKALSNYPPYVFGWDTTREANGWHEIEAWMVDDASSTFKTRKVRVFVNNPGGRTERKGAASNALTPTRNPNQTGVQSTVAGPRELNTTRAGIASPTKGGSVAPRVSATTLPNPAGTAKVTSSSGIKPAPPTEVVSTNVRNMTPTGARVVVVPSPAAPPAKVASPARAPRTEVVVTVAKAPAVKKGTVVATAPQTSPITPQVRNITTVSSLIPVQKGQKIPNLASFAVVYNSQFVNFDVAPRVDSGIPMAPFRHLILKAGGQLTWESATKTVHANAEGQAILVRIGNTDALVGGHSVSLELAPYLDRGRTIVPLSFLRDALKVNVEYDKATGHVLITSAK